jgi:UDP-N-acetyl-2-amino-2-deoxyglucuronate dehydrogenase
MSQSIPFGIIGTGMIARFHAKALAAMDSAHLHAVHDAIPERAVAMAAEFGVVAHATLDEFLADPGIRVVTVCTPSGAHLEPALAALAAGKHVICEKPLEITSERIDRLMAAAAKAGVSLSGIFNRRFHPAMRALKQAVDAGRFGKLTLVEAAVKWYRDQAYYDSGAWRGTWALDGGGALMNQSIHIIDQLIYLCGEVEWVQGNTACLAHERIEVEDTATALVQFRDGPLGVITGSTACWSSTGHPAEVQLCGSRGSVFLADEAFKVWDFAEPAAADDDVRANLMVKSDAGGLGANDPTAINFTGHVRNFQDVIDAIHAGCDPSVTASEARRAVAVIEAIYRSAREGGARVQPA